MKTIEEAAREYSVKQIEYLDIEYSDSMCKETDIKISIADFTAGVEFAQQWISVEEELPEDKTEIIAKANMYKEWFVFYEKGFKDSEYLKQRFTHWRPIELK